jgi:hypothetical protein
MRAFFLLLLVLVLGCSAESSDAYVVTEFRTDRFNVAPNESRTFDVPAGARTWRVGGNPGRASSPFVETMWFWLAADGDNLDFFRGDELGADRLREVPVGNAELLHVDNAGGAYVAGAVVWTLELERR